MRPRRAVLRHRTPCRCLRRSGIGSSAMPQLAEGNRPHRATNSIRRSNHLGSSHRTRSNRRKAEPGNAAA